MQYRLRALLIGVTLISIALACSSVNFITLPIRESDKTAAASQPPKFGSACSRSNSSELFSENLGNKTTRSRIYTYDPFTSFCELKRGKSQRRSEWNRRLARSGQQQPNGSAISST
jgi:hypothetical protein